jgi:hypothetical protein
MKRLIINIVLFFVIAPFITSAIAQNRSGKKMTKQKYYQPFNPSTVETIEGEVLNITYHPGKYSADSLGVHMTVKTDEETIAVHLGPNWYLEQQEEINKGDQVLITGSRITFKNKPAIIAAEVTRGQMTLQLRNQKGFPVWRGWRQGKRMNQ